MTNKNYTIACDGSCLKNPNGAVGWAWARDDGEWLSDGFITGTNQRAELLGLMSVLVTHPKNNLIIQMDSQFVINVATRWVTGWAKRGYRKADGAEVANIDLIKPLHQLLQTHTGTLEFQWVKGHLADNRYPLNTVADVKAGQASRRARDGQHLYLDSKGRTHLPSWNTFINNLTSHIK